MNASRWQDSYSVGVVELDSHHKQILELVRKMTSEDWLTDNSDELGDALDELAGYVTVHFGAEEAYMEQFNYENYEEHLEQHVEYIRKITKLTADWMDGADTVQDDLVNFLRQWWLNHILAEDKKYTATFNNNGLV